MRLRRSLFKMLAAIGFASGPGPAIPQVFKGPSVPLSDVPDSPQSFGLKATWFALPTTETEKVVEAFRLYDTVPANWSTGLNYREPPYSVDYNSENGLAFVSPPVNGWTLVIVENAFDTGTPELQERLEAHLSALSIEFGEAQFYGTYRVVDYAAWIRFQKGQMTRGLVFAGGGEGYYLNFGNTTPEELELGFRDLTGMTPEDLNFTELSPEDEKDDHYWPNEDDPSALAGYWSINPLELEVIETVPGTGILGLIPKPPG